MVCCLKRLYRCFRRIKTIQYFRNNNSFAHSPFPLFSLLCQETQLNPSKTKNYKSKMASSRGGDGDFSSGSDSNSYRNNGGGSCLWNFLCCRSSTNYQNGYGCYFNCYIDEENRSRWLHLIAKLTKTIVWRTIHVIFSLFLLFGPAVQNLIIECGVTGDTIFSIIRICMLLFFIVDMTVRCITEERYFVYSLCKRGNGGGNNSSDGFDSTFAIGSFMFWCDLISTVSILYDLPSINKGRYAMIKSTWEVINGSLVSLCF